MSLTYVSIFNLDNEYDINKLNESYNSRKKKIIDNSDLSDMDKEIYINNLDRYYIQARNDYHRRELLKFEPFDPRRMINFYNEFNDIFNVLDDEFSPLKTRRIKNSSSSSTTYKEKVMKDGSSIIVNESRVNNDGDVTVKTNCYRRLPNGGTEALSYKDAISQIKSSDNNQLL